MCFLFSVLTQPTDATVNVGSPVTLTAGVTGNTGTPSYLWYKEDTLVFNDTKNDATSNFVIASVVADSAGDYRCEVTMETAGTETGPYESNNATISTRDVATSFGATTDTTETTQAFTCTYTGDDDVKSVAWNNPAGVVTDTSAVSHSEPFNI